MTGSRRKAKKWIWLFGSMLLMLCLLTACSLKKKTRRTVATPQPTLKTDAMTGIVIENNQSSGELKLRELDSEAVTSFFYNETSVFQDEFKEEREGEKVEPGEILQVFYLPEEGTVTNAVVPDDVWNYGDVKKFHFDSDEGSLTVDDKKYQFNNKTFCYSGNEQIEPMDFDSQDTLTVRGMGIHAYSVVRTQGHGYIRLANYTDFLGGMAEVDSDMLLPVTENMLITVAEGSYRLTLLKKRMAATKTVVVTNGQETVADFSDYKKEIKDIGEVTFDIKPEGAELKLNGTSVDYSTPVTLNYGKYKMVVSLAGYADYTGILNVEQPSKPIHVELEEANATVTVKTPTPTSASASSSSDSDAATKKFDSEHTITVTAPEGAEVFLDGVYKGMAPCTFTKVIGSQTITLSDDGYQTKTYQVDVLDDGKDVKLTFADLEKEDSTSSSEN